jgi:peptidyl-prolyl cis-trans isomerase D
MLKLLRKYSRSWFIAVAIGALIIVFIFFFGGGSFRSARLQEVATVNGAPITLSEYARQYQQNIKDYQERTQGELSDEVLKSKQFKEQALGQLIDEVLLDQGAYHLGIGISDAELRQSIKEIPVFQENGQFSERRYLGLLARSRITPATFEEQERRRLLRRKVIQTVTAFAKVSDGELQEFFRLAREEVSVNYLAVSLEPFAAKVQPPEADLKKYYDEHQGEFKIPERVKVRYLLFRPAAFLEQVKITPPELADYMQKHAGELLRPKVIRVRELFLALPPKASAADRARLEKKAQDLLLQAKKGADFAQLVEKNSLDEASRTKGGDLGEVKRGDKGADWDRVAFALKAGEIDLAITAKGYHLIRVEEVKETEKMPETEAKALATLKLKEEKARELARDAARRAREQMLGGNAAEVAQKFKVSLQETPLFAQTEPIAGLGAQRAFYDAAFKLKPQEVSPVVNLPLGFAVLQGVERQAAGVQPFEQVKERVRQAVARQAARKEAEAEAARLLDRLRQGEPLAKVAAQAALPVQDSGYFTRQQGFLKQPLADSLTTAAFQLSAKAPFPDKPLFFQNKYYILAFKSRRVPTEEDFKKEEARLREEFLQYKRQLIFDAWLAKERQRATIKIFELPS